MDPEQQDQEDSFGAKLFWTLMAVGLVCAALGIHLL
jgi:hypothetical protein